MLELLRRLQQNSVDRDLLLDLRAGELAQLDEAVALDLVFAARDGYRLTAQGRRVLDAALAWRPGQVSLHPR